MATNWRCECADRGCREHPGHGDCYEPAKHRVLRRDDMTNGGTFMCKECAIRAKESGLFRLGRI